MVALNVVLITNVPFVNQEKYQQLMHHNAKPAMNLCQVAQNALLITFVLIVPTINIQPLMELNVKIVVN